MEMGFSDNIELGSSDIEINIYDIERDVSNTKIDVNNLHQTLIKYVIDINN